jgi:hypothetical protein
MWNRLRFRGYLAAGVALGFTLCLTHSANAQTSGQQPPPPVDPASPPTTPGATTPPATGISPWGDMQAGGLKPPAPLANGTPQSPPSATLVEEAPNDKDEDSGRGLSWFWLEAQGGFEHLGLQTFNVDETNFAVGLVETEASGGAISAGIGAQIVFLTLGARARMAFLDAWQVGTIGGEVGFKIPLGIFEPRFDLGAGYASLGNFDGVVADAINIRGFYARAGAGLDFYPASVIALGFHASFDFMGLTRPELDPAKIAEIQADPDIGDLPAAQEQALALEGSGYGAALALQGTIGLHF